MNARKDTKNIATAANASAMKCLSSDCIRSILATGFVKAFRILIDETLYIVFTIKVNIVCISRAAPSESLCNRDCSLLVTGYVTKLIASAIAVVIKLLIVVWSFHWINPLHSKPFRIPAAIAYA